MFTIYFLTWHITKKNLFWESWKKKYKLRQGNSSVAMSPPKLRNEIICCLLNVQAECNSCLTVFNTIAYEFVYLFFFLPIG